MVTFNVTIAENEAHQVLVHAETPDSDATPAEIEAGKVFKLAIAEICGRIHKRYGVTNVKEWTEHPFAVN